MLLQRGRVFLARLRGFLQPIPAHAGVQANGFAEFAAFSRNSRAILLPAAGSRKLSVPTATNVAPARSRSRACAPVWTPPIPTLGPLTRAETAATCASATLRMAGPLSPPVRPPSQGSPSGASGIARSVLMSDTASAPPDSAAWAQAA